jgi:hypothetical protein
MTPAPYTLDGIWKYTVTSKGGGTHRGSLRPTMSGSQVTGILENTVDNSSSGVSGLYANDVLELSRETGVDNTVQNYRLMKQTNNRFACAYWNRGRWPDEGTIEIER